MTTAGFVVPCSIILASYLIIWIATRRVGKDLKGADVDPDTRSRIARRDFRMTFTILVICLCYFVCVLPMSIINIIDRPSEETADLYLSFYIIYWLQYSINFVIYAAKSGPYKEAYGHIIKGIIEYFRKVLGSLTKEASDILQ